MGLTPLMVATALNKGETVDLFLKQGADVNARTKINSTALMEAAGNGNREIVEMLLKSGADPTVKLRRPDKKYWEYTAAQLADALNHTEVARLINKAAGR